MFSPSMGEQQTRCMLDVATGFTLCPRCSHSLKTSSHWFCHSLCDGFWPYQLRPPLKPWPHHSRERELCRCSAAPIQVPWFWGSDAPDPALLGHRSLRDPAPGVPDPSQRDVSMRSHQTVQGLQLTLSCRDRNQEKAMVHP